MAKDKTLLFAVLGFIHVWTSSVDSKTIRLPLRGVVINVAVNNNPLDNTVPRNMAPNTDDDNKDSRPEMLKKGSPFLPDPFHKEIILSMVPNAVDDRYDGCTEEMKEKVNNEYLLKEKSQTQFKESWRWAESCASKVKDRFKNDNENFNPNELQQNHIKAICAYTNNMPKIYEKFNEAVRTQKKNEYTTFQYHSLHFWLTDALRVLKQNQAYSNKQDCKITYRRTKDIYRGRVNQEMRFGYFASSSLDKDSNPSFGDKSCFEIYTCYGAYLKSYPRYGKNEMEVLIPPYEVFKVTAVLTKKKDNKLWCDTVYQLQSTKKPQSNLNCELVRHSAENNQP